MRKYLFLFLFITSSVVSLYAQQVTGTVSDREGALPGATVTWAGTNIGVSTDANGRFSIPAVKGYDALTASYLGYLSDTVNIQAGSHDFLLTADANQIDAVTVSANQRGNITALSSIGKTELITFTGLTKMACCNLAESFENSASVTVGYSDAISGARQIRMLGLTGIYSQLLDESRPVLRGLGTTYGLSYTPGMWLQGIQVSKGTSSVTNGHESIAGQINLDHRKPTDPDRLFVNGYFDQDLRTELNVTSSQQLSRKLSTVVLAHGSIDQKKIDHIHDGFLDTPLTRQVNVANKWLYTADNGIQLRWGVKYLHDTRRGGQVDFDAGQHRGGTEVYGSRIRNENFNGYLKAAVPVGRTVYNEDTGEASRSNIALVADYNFYRQHSYFGLKDYDGRQNSLYANLMYNLNIDKHHTLIMGASLTSDSYREELNDTFTDGRTDSGTYILATNRYNFDRTETETGVFAEYNLNIRSRFNLIAGLRADHSNQYDWFVTPRAHTRWEIIDGLVLRASAGKGYRSANVVTDHSGMLATGRRLVFADQLDRLEESLTYGGSLAWVFRLGTDERASLSFDYFRTEFRNKLLADQEYDAGAVYLYNVAGKPLTDTWQGDFSWSPFTGFDVFATFRYTDTRINLNRPDGSVQQVRDALTDKFKTLLNLQYATRHRKWVFDFTAQLNGQSRLPVQDGITASFDYSPVYPVFFAQVSRKFGKWDVYIGGENLGDYTQDHPVLSPDSPFERSFNSSVVWGPLMGRKIYAGFRFNL